MSIKYTLSVIMLASLVACGGGGGGSPGSDVASPTRLPVNGIVLSADLAPANLSCTDYVEYDTGNGRLTNNVWNKQAAGTFPYAQCITAKGPLSAKVYGWSWNWPANSGSVFAYPEIVYGWKPWNGGSSNVPTLPIRVSAITTLRFSYDLTVTTNGKHNVSTSMWLTSNGATSNKPDSSHITTEFMIWTDGYDFHPAGNLAAIYTTQTGTQYEVWFDPYQTDASGQNANVWKYVAYRAVVPSLTPTIDLKLILQDAVTRGYVSATDYVSNVELGNEIMSSSGQTWINSISLVAQ
jgi:hypothetical protein